jgi:hypothetical protein
MSESAPNRNIRPAPGSGDTNAKRRSQRVQISMPVLVRAKSGTHNFEEETKTAVVNANGCSLTLNSKVSVGQQIFLLNMKTIEELPCRVAFVGQADSGRVEVGIEFAEPSPLFWRISFPPEDWDPSTRKLPTGQAKPGAARDRLPSQR